MVLRWLFHWTHCIGAGCRGLAVSIMMAGPVPMNAPGVRVGCLWLCVFGLMMEAGNVATWTKFLLSQAVYCGSKSNALDCQNESRRRSSSVCVTTPGWHGRRLVSLSAWMPLLLSAKETRMKYHSAKMYCPKCWDRFSQTLRDGIWHSNHKCK